MSPLSTQWFELYGVIILAAYAVIAIFYALIRSREADIAADQGMVAEIEEGQKRGVDYPDALLNRLPTRQDVEVALLHAKINRLRFARSLRVYAVGLAVLAAPIVLAYFYFSVKGHVLLDGSAPTFTPIDAKRVACIQALTSRQIRKGEAISVNTAVSSPESESAVSCYTSRGSVEAAFSTTPAGGCHSLTHGLTVAITAPGFDPPKRVSTIRYRSLGPKCIADYNWILIARNTGTQVVTLQFMIRNGRSTERAQLGHLGIEVAEPASLESFTPLIVAVVSLAGAVLTTILSTLLSGRKDSKGST